jgi:cellulose biosynthesis protein BcsQ
VICVADECYWRGADVLLVDVDPQGTARTWSDVLAEATTAYLEERGLPEF